MGATTIAVIFCLLFCTSIHAGDVLVKTAYGTLRGRGREITGHGMVNSFLGIPYASSPTGQYRFQPPVPPKAWSGVRDALDYGAACPQTIVLPLATDEDCLYLNIFLPQTQANKTSIPTLPVMVYIHGGSYIEGTGSVYNSTVLAVRGVVVVTINYRLGVLGFLSTEDAVSPGNFGMLDQIMALYWVRKCISAFGGNPNDITIFGESAGATSVSLQLYSPLSNGLFKRAISESGVALAPWAAILRVDKPDPNTMAHTLGSLVGCLNETSECLVQCLRQQDAQTLVDAGVKVQGPMDRLIWSPVVENIYGFLPDSPMKLAKAGKFKKVPTIHGTNKDEDSSIAADVPGIATGVTLEYFLADIKTFVTTHYKANISKILSAVHSVYIAPTNISDPVAIRTAFIQFHSDHDFVAADTLEAQIESSFSSEVFLYTFSYRSKNSFRPEWMGVTHTAELPYVFGAPFSDDPIFKLMWPTKWTLCDQQVSANMINMWTNFAKHGNPTPSPVSGITWENYSTNKAYLDIDLKLISGHNFRPAVMNLWNKVIPELNGQ